MPDLLQFAIVAAAAFMAAGLTLYSGFGLGTLLLPVFALFELLPRFRQLEFERRWLPLGGVPSGFFGGLSGHQGAHSQWKRRGPKAPPVCGRNQLSLCWVFRHRCALAR